MYNKVEKEKKSGASFPKDLDERLNRWFHEKIGIPTRLQVDVWSEISSGKNVLVVSPTGTGKTLSAVIPPVNDILTGTSERGSTSIVYISPMKALGADLVKTMETLSKGLGRIKGKKERKWGRGRRKKDERLENAKLHVGIRTGDVSQTERRHMVLDPPDILVTTPENLLLMLCSKARDTLINARYMIIDEVHEMVPSKRGALLSLCVEYLTRLIKENGNREPVRIGLSATVRPDSTAARFLGGYDEEGKARKVSVIKETSLKETNISIRTLTGSIEGDEDVLEKIIDDIGGLIDTEEGSMVVFHNTRRSAERTAFRLIQSGHESVMPHHGSLGLDVRKTAEEGLKDGKLKAIVSSTSLELGLDIGLVDLVCQISSPKEPGRLLQRFGRSGHSLEGSSRGIIYPVNGMDMMECLAVTRSAQKGKLKKLEVPDNPMDVLAQFMIGLSIRDGGTNRKEIGSIARSSYPFRNMKMVELDSLLELLSMRMGGAGSVSPRLWHDENDGSYLPRRNTKQAFYLNCGTIPKETTYKVIDELNHKHLGELSRDFGETLYERDVILLGSRPFRIIGFSGTKIMVKEEQGAHATVPSWSGEINPRSLDVSLEMLKLMNGGSRFSFRSASGIELRTDLEGKRILREMISTMEEQGTIPSLDRIPVEEVRRGRTKRAYIFHLPLGRNITEPLARSLSYGIRRKLGARADYYAVDNGFSITSPRKLDKETIIRSFGSDRFLETIRELVLGSSLFRTRFSHCLSKSLLILSRFRGKETSAMYRRSRTDKLLKMVTDAWYSEGGWGSSEGPLSGLVLLAEESFKEVFNERIDLESCKGILDGISSGDIGLDLLEELDRPTTMGAQMIGEQRSRGDDKLPENLRETGSGDDERTEDPSGTKYKGLNDNNECPDIPTWEGLEMEGLGWIDPDTMSTVSSSRTGILKDRCRRLTYMGGPVSIMKRLPFAVHPISLLVRSEKGMYRDLRSAVKSGRLVPGRFNSMDCMMDPKWKEGVELLSPNSDIITSSDIKKAVSKKVFNRSDIGELLDKKGDELTSALKEMQNNNELSRFPEEVVFHLGGEERYIINNFAKQDPDNLDDSDVDFLVDFLRRFGAFTIAELSSMFNWPIGEHLPTLESAYSLGKIDVRIGPKGVVKGSEDWKGLSNSLWIFPNKETYPLNDGSSHMQNEVLVLPSTDPLITLVSPDDSWIEEERVRGAKNRKFTIIDREGRRIGNCHVLETTDTIRTIQVEIEDYEMIEVSSTSILRTLGSYERLGYDVFTIEGLLGIPAGEAAEKAVNVFIESDFRRTDTPKGQILVKGCEVGFGIKRERILKEIMKRQGLLPGSNMEHPIQIILTLGSFNDRWELLSRLGSVRYTRSTDLNDERIAKMISDHWTQLEKLKDLSQGSLDIEWNCLLSGGTERLSDQKDLTKRFSLRKGIMDQSGSVWSLLDLFLRFPDPRRSGLPHMGPVEERIRQKVLRGPLSELDGFIRTQGLESTADALMKSRLLLEDPWGKFEYPFRDGRIGDEPLPSQKGIPRGTKEMKWTIKNCQNLGAFTIEDLINYSPGLVDRSKLRRIIRSITGDLLTKTLSPDLGMRIVYTIRGVDITSEEKEETDEGKQDLILISPKDRISRVVSPDIRGRLSRVSGFSIFRGPRAVALISIKKMNSAFKNTGFGERVTGSSHLENYIIKKAWVDLRYRKNELLRDIKKSFFNMGYQIVTDDEKMRIESLYRDIEKQESLD